MPLFQNSVLNSYLNKQEKTLVENQYALFKTYFLNNTIQQNILASKEEEFQEGFLRELFVNIFGYTIKPNENYNLVVEKKNESNSKKADGAILLEEKIIAVIELKGTDTIDLNKIEVQAFGYKNNQADCKYVITSNFQKIRFYIDNAIDYLEWDLFKLDFEGFRLLYLCLHVSNLLANIPSKIKTESITVEDNITKQLYKEYSQFRKNLFNNIIELNPNNNKLVIFKKTQKLLDRFLFLFFAEDRMLVPPNSVRIILDQWQELKEKFDEHQPLYDRFKKYFGYLNVGFIGKQFEIFAYNGGLFAPDEILDNIIIDDAILYNATLCLSNYDYNSEVDVNILGHIFEHSLTEIEELELEITNNDIPSTKEKTTTKRKKDGVFYTPKYITKYIVENTVGTLCKNKKEELNLVEEDYHKLTKKEKKKLFTTLTTYKEWLLHITIIDPACGSGAFLNQALEYLITEHKWISELEANITNSSIVFDIETTIIENNIFGVDINEESVEIAKLSLWLRTARKGRKLNSLNNNIKCGNSLIDDVNIAGDKAFNWQEQFPKIFEKGGFDVVIGNPPYTYRNSIMQNEREFFKQYYLSTEGNFDLYKFFIEKINTISKIDGYSSMIVPNTFLSAITYSKLREIIIENFQVEEIFDLGLDVFEGVVVESIIFRFRKCKQEKQNTLIKIDRNRIGNDFSVENIYSIDLMKYYNIDKSFNINLSVELDSIIEKCQHNSIELGKIAYCTVGINTGYIKDDLTSDTQINHKYHKMLNGKNIGRNFVDWDNEWIMYDIDFVKSKGDRGRSLPPEYIFKEDKILVQRTRRGMKRKLVCYLDTDKYYNLNRLSNIILTNKNFNLKYIYAILNSELLDFYFNKYFNEYEVKPVHLARLPIKELKIEQQNILSNKTDNILILNKELQNKNIQFQKLLYSKFETININTKLDKWYTLSFSEFSKELLKQKIKLTLTQESEWLAFFEQEKQKALAIKTEIDNTDKEIDKMVYELYGLTEEEIKIVEGK